MNAKEDCEMKASVGLWIDHRKAVIVVVSDGRECASEVRSNVESQPGRLAGVRSMVPFEAQLVMADDSHERKLKGDLNRYYEEVIAAIGDAKSLLIFGPGEAKGELRKRLAHAKFRGDVVAVETADKMTHHQIVAKVRELRPGREPAGAPGKTAAPASK